MSEHTTEMADYTLTIKADSGYEATTEGRCTADQYGCAIAALHGIDVKAQNNDLLAALKACRSEIWRLLDAKGITPETARLWPEIVISDAAIAKAEAGRGEG